MESKVKEIQETIDKYKIAKSRGTWPSSAFLMGLLDKITVALEGKVPPGFKKKE